MITPIKTNNFQQNINFNGFKHQAKPRDYNKLQNFKQLKDIPHLTCACCGTEMNPEKEIKKYEYIIANAADEQLIKALTDSMQYMNPAAQSVAKKIINLAGENESADIKDILTILIKDRKFSFLEKQNKKIQDKLKKYMRPEISHQLPRDAFATLSQTYELSQRKRLNKELTQQNTGIGYIRDNLLQKFRYSINAHPEKKELLSRIIRDVQKLDSYFNSADAFILRCEKLNKADIAELFFDSKKATVEHIIPRAEGGDNSLGNLLIFCRECNVDRDCMSYQDLPIYKPGFISNLNRYLHTVQEEIDKGNLNDLKNYSAEVTDKLYKVSDGNIDLVG